MPADGDTVIFPSGAARTTNTNDLSGLTLNRIVFSGSGTSYSLAGNAFTLTNSITATNSASDTIANDITLATADATIFSDVFLLQLTGSLSGNNGLIKSGTGTLSLEHSNSFSGQAIVASGTMSAVDPFALGSTNGSTVVSNGASLILTGIFSGPNYVSTSITNETLILNGSGVTNVSAALNASDYTLSVGTNTWAGPVVLASDTSVSGFRSNTLSLVGQISGSGDLTVGLPTTYYFTNIVILGGASANTYTGNTRVSTGTLLQLAKPSGSAIPSGSLTIMTNATVRESANDQLGNISVTVSNTAVFDLNGFTDTVGALSGAGSVTLGSGTLGVNADNGSSTFTGVISGTGGLKKHGSGTLTLAGTNTFTGTNEIVLGNEIVNGQQPQTPMLVDGPAKLGGTGTVGNVNSPGRIAPGDNGIGTLTTSNLTFTSSGTFIVELGSPTNCDSLNVRGTVTLAAATLQVTPAFTGTATMGQTFTIITNDAADAVTGTFSGLPEAATFVTGGYKFRINYAAGTGNDVVLTLVDVPATATGSSVTAGNGNHAIDLNECNNLSIVITNITGAPIIGVTGTLYTTTMNVMITQPQSPFADVPTSGKGTNTIAFGLSTLTGFPCGTNISLVLTLATASHGTFNVPLTLPTGEAAASPVRFDNSTVVPVPDGFFAESTNNVSSFNSPLKKVGVMLWLTHPRDADLDISLISPTGVSVTLASALGGAGSNYGTNCAPDSARTTFDDFAPGSITAAGAPFVGVFRPQNNLAAFNNGAANGAWRLHVADTVPGNFGSIQCWSLLLYPTACVDGGSYCGTCPGAITGAITGGDLAVAGRIFLNGSASSCLAAKAYPGATAGAFHADTYNFTNTTGSDACISVGLISAFDVEAGAYLTAFNPAAIGANYLADAGTSTTAAGGSTSFSFNCPAGSNFVVTVTEMVPGAGVPSYTLLVSGLTCPPPALAISSVATNAVRVDWPSYAGGYKLAATLSLAPTNWIDVPNEPVISGGRFAVTNSTAATNKYYRLHKP